jgi:hypothetical protein
VDSGKAMNEMFITNSPDAGYTAPQQHEFNKITAPTVQLSREITATLLHC